MKELWFLSVSSFEDFITKTSTANHWDILFLTFQFSFVVRWQEMTELLSFLDKSCYSADMLASSPEQLFRGLTRAGFHLNEWAESTTSLSVGSSDKQH